MHRPWHHLKIKPAAKASQGIARAHVKVEYPFIPLAAEYLFVSWPMGSMLLTSSTHLCVVFLCRWILNAWISRGFDVSQHLWSSCVFSLAMMTPAPALLSDMPQYTRSTDMALRHTLLKALLSSIDLTCDLRVESHCIDAFSFCCFCYFRETQDALFYRNGTA